MTPNSSEAPARLRTLGDAALTVELGTGIEDATHARVLGLKAAVEAARGQGAFAGVIECVASFASLTVHFDPAQTDAQALSHALLAQARADHAVAVQGRCWRLPACFAPDCAPDLAALAARKGLSEDEVVRLFTGAMFRVYAIGFLPGFPYMGGLPEALSVPRHETPRVQVPAGSVATALGMCAIYPYASPGGWWLLGRTPLVLFDPAREASPALLRAGDIVRWQPISRAAFDALETEGRRGGLDPDRFLLPEAA